MYKVTYYIPLPLTKKTYPEKRLNPALSFLQNRGRRTAFPLNATKGKWGERYKWQIGDKRYKFWQLYTINTLLILT